MAKYTVITPAGAYPEPQELAAVKILMKYGDVEFIPPVRTKGMHTPDVFWLGKEWEIKTPQVRTRRWNVETLLKRAVKQSPNIILDLRYMDERMRDKYINEIEKQLRLFRSIRRMKIIKNNEEILDFKR